VLNVTATGPTAASYLTVWPAGTDRPIASNLNFTAAQTIPNMVIAKVGAGGQISIFNAAGTTDVIVDVLGWFPAGGSYTSLTPARLLDSRVLPATPTPPPTPTPPRTPEPPPLPPPAPPIYAPVPPVVVSNVFDPGTYTVNIQIPPGRYVAEDAVSGCYWQRLSGFAGTLVANDFRTFSGRVIVDILGSDITFSFESSCGILKPYVPPATPVGVITPGSNVVGQHIFSGTYSANAAYGCYWQRSVSFDGSIPSIIANDFVTTPGPILVTINPGDVGFYTTAECGTWTRIG
jgi:hypothetical protein